MAPDVRIRAVMRAAAGGEVVEALERNPGSAVLRERGWTPAWFELDIDVDERDASERSFSVIWIEPGRPPAEVADEELELALADALRNLRDYEGVELEREDLPPEAIELRIEF